MYFLTELIKHIYISIFIFLWTSNSKNTLTTELIISNQIPSILVCTLDSPNYIFLSIYHYLFLSSLCYILIFFNSQK